MLQQLKNPHDIGLVLGKPVFSRPSDRTTSRSTGEKHMMYERISFERMIRSNFLGQIKNLNDVCQLRRFSVHTPHDRVKQQRHQVVQLPALKQWRVKIVDAVA